MAYTNIYRSVEITKFNYLFRNYRNAETIEEKNTIIKDMVDSDDRLGELGFKDFDSIEDARKDARKHSGISLTSGNVGNYYYVTYTEIFENDTETEEMNLIETVLPQIEVTRHYGDLNVEGFRYEEHSDGQVWFYDNATAGELSTIILHPEEIKYDDNEGWLYRGEWLPCK